MLMGLLINGKAVNGLVQQANALCEEILGRDMVEGPSARGQGIFYPHLECIMIPLV